MNPTIPHLFLDEQMRQDALRPKKNYRSLSPNEVVQAHDEAAIVSGYFYPVYSDHKEFGQKAGNFPNARFRTTRPE